MKPEQLEQLAQEAFICRTGHPTTGQGTKKYLIQTQNYQICTAPLELPRTYKKDLQEIALCKYHKKTTQQW